MSQVKEIKILNHRNLDFWERMEWSKQEQLILEMSDKGTDEYFPKYAMQLRRELCVIRNAIRRPYERERLFCMLRNIQQAYERKEPGYV